MKNFFFGSLFGILLLVVLALMCLCSCFLMFASSISRIASSDFSTGEDLGTYAYESGDVLSENKILVINVEGIILNERPQDSFLSLLNPGVVYGYDIKNQFIQAAEDTNIKGIILRVNSPGGTITGAQAIADGIQYYQGTTGNQVVGFGTGLVASGGYWAISGTDKIYLDSGSTIGSIGVILGPLERYRNVVSNENVATTDGITEEYITSGKGKDLGNPYRDITNDERQILQRSVDDSYEVFVNKVSLERGITVETLRNQIGAYIYGDKQALELKLIDQIANREEVIEDFVTSLDLTDYQIIKYDVEIDFFSSLFGMSASVSNKTNSATICNKVNTALVIEESYLKTCLKD